MNEAPTAPEDLISHHFDGPLSPPDHQRLADALLTDPVVRADFVATARLHAGLEALAPPQPLVRKRPVLRWLAIAGAAAALVIGAGLALVKTQENSQVTITMESQDESLESNSRKSKPSGWKKRVIKSVAAPLSAGGEPFDVQGLLSDYYVNLVPHGLTVEEALVGLEQAIKDANIMKRPELDALTFRAGGASPPILYEPIPWLKDTTDVKRQIDELNEFRAQSAFGRMNLPAFSPPITAYEFLQECAYLRKITQQPGSITYPEKPIKYSAVDFSHRIPRRLQSLTVGAEFIRAPRSILPEGFNEESGLVMDDRRCAAFQEILDRRSDVTICRTPNINQNPSQLCTVESTADKEWGSGVTNYQWSVESTYVGELLKFSGEAGLGKIAEGAESNSNGIERTGLTYTEFEIYMPRGSSALCSLEGAPDPGYIHLMLLTVEDRFSGQQMDGITVEFKDGRKLLRSPWAPSARPIDVTGLPSGRMMECPYTGYLYRIP